MLVAPPPPPTPRRVEVTIGLVESVDVEEVVAVATPATLLRNREGRLRLCELKRQLVRGSEERPVELLYGWKAEVPTVPAGVTVVAVVVSIDDVVDERALAEVVLVG